MKIYKEVAKHDDAVLEVSEITLLSVEEYNAAKEYIPEAKYCWWLRTAGNTPIDAALVLAFGRLREAGYIVSSEKAVRPALRVSNFEALNLVPGNKVIDFAGCNWTVIAKDMMLCDSSIGDHCFRLRKDLHKSDANVYEASDVKKYLETWAADMKLFTAAESK
jgi:hypothetical protein